MRKCLLASALLFLILPLCACGGADREGAAAPDTARVIVSFDYEKQSGYASNQFAVWVEDGDGALVKTLYATRFTASGGYKNRPDAIPAWVERSQIASMSKSGADAVAGATPKAGALAYTWDLTDEQGTAVAPGDYTVFVEGSLRWKNRVLYRGTIAVGGDPAAVQADAEYFYEESEDQPALTEVSKENSMIGAVTITFVPAAEPLGTESGAGG